MGKQEEEFPFQTCTVWVNTVIADLAAEIFSDLVIQYHTQEIRDRTASGRIIKLI
jgi:hypothetical protein